MKISKAILIQMLLILVFIVMCICSYALRFRIKQVESNSRKNLSTPRDNNPLLFHFPPMVFALIMKYKLKKVKFFQS